MNDPVIDTDALQRLQRIGGEGLVRQMISLFLEHGESRITQADAAGAAGDASGVEHAAHALKSSAGNVGARRLQAAAGAAERAAESRDTAELAVLVKDMHTEYDAAAAALNGFLQELDQ